MTDRTPGPYRAFDGEIFDSKEIRIAETDGFHPHRTADLVEREMPEVEEEANAEFLCRAANAHDALVEAAEYALECLIDSDDDRAVVQSLRAALAAATEPGS